ncbi:hypothetical protein SAMN05216243_3334 [Sediminibacillus albus]|uniref:Uncharacterized protein n=1 Tax=Sediminibacillus albus TaxID=407036 RepID=A0A1G9CAT4_9BACI|nr:hypothetical protein SAMN05216243_3334 [Sediminibacillus albus]
MRPHRAQARGGSPAARGKRSVFPQRSSRKVVRTAVSAQAEYVDSSENRTRLRPCPRESGVCCRRKFKHPTLLKRKKVVTVFAGYLKHEKKSNEFES